MRELLLQNQMVVAMVGLPARGKSYISRKLKNYLNWLDIPCQIFNIGQLRRKISSKVDSDYFDPFNQTFSKQRQQIAKACFDQLCEYLSKQSKNAVAIFDGTNSTLIRRDWIRSRCKQKGVQLFFVESVCQNQSIITTNVKQAKLANEDYKDMQDKQKIIKDFHNRIQNYKKVYQRLGNDQAPFFRVFNVDQKFQVVGKLSEKARKIARYLSCLRGPSSNRIYLARHGQSQYNVQQRLGGNPKLTENGLKYAKSLAQYFNKNQENIKLVSSCMLRAVQTASKVKQSWMQVKCLNEINAGKFQQMHLDEFQQMFPDEFQKRTKNKFYYRYPNGESYLDLVERVDQIILWIQSQKKQNVIVVISHQAISRVLAGYFVGKYGINMTEIKFPLNYLLVLDEYQLNYFQHQVFFEEKQSYYRKKSLNLEQF